eukprot:GEMP01094183.1.p1 GENE.GEMP01094183.1~~GEMP01094183.1.p1  ORF type:complete len:119 (-),score=0.14 GEMP01094183.1:112-468(-)
MCDGKKNAHVNARLTKKPYSDRIYRYIYIARWVWSIETNILRIIEKTPRWVIGEHDCTRLPRPTLLHRITKGKKQTTTKHPFSLAFIGPHEYEGGEISCFVYVRVFLLSPRCIFVVLH